ncbi:unnamed protein product [Gulo gulo]|uniref:Uncharacterized protein n=1 Tax=Gulo gulo TaxID=48420 RepID=A0A9X9M346_GULGU|nr:unnamed protein product [Gulo gulo]
MLLRERPLRMRPLKSPRRKPFSSLRHPRSSTVIGGGTCGAGQSAMRPCCSSEVQSWVTSSRPMWGLDF